VSHRVSEPAAADLDEIWYYVAKESGNLEIANRLSDSITDAFLLLARQPYLGRSRDNDFGTGLRSFPVGAYVVVYRVESEDVPDLSGRARSSRP
jgi:plasmid stabilization system protein ParE